MQRWSASREASTEYGDVYVFCELEEDPTGDYVRYEDYKAALAEAEKTIGALKHRIGEIEDERGAEIARLRGALDAYRSEEHERHCAWRDLTCDDLCHRCHGAGIRAYGSTATWRGGIGGQAITSDVCDACWGSGSKSRKWPSHRLARTGGSGEKEGE